MDLIVNQLEVYHIFTLIHLFTTNYLFIFKFTKYIHISACFVVKPLLQDICTESDLLLKELDLVPAHPFIGLTVDRMLHLLYLVS